MSKPEIRILKTIEKRVGEENAITGRELGIPGSELRYYINKLRKAGHPICSSGNGYWWAKDKQDVDKVVGSLKARAGSILEVAGYLELTMLGMEDE